MRVGSRIKGANKILGRTFDWTVELTDHDRPTKNVGKSKGIQANAPFGRRIETERTSSRIVTRKRQEVGPATSEVHAVPDGTAQNFQGGRITETNDTIAIS